MYRSIYFKIILILVIFIITVMTVVGAGLVFGVSTYYTEDFTAQMNEAFDRDSKLLEDLTAALESEDYVSLQNDILQAYGASLGIDMYRDVYILDVNGNVLSTDEAGEEKFLTKTPNMLAAMNGRTSGSASPVESYMDYAVFLDGGENDSIVYIIDTKEEFSKISWIVFSIILQILLLGLAIAIFLSFFLANAITAPIQSLTLGAQRIAEGRFSHQIDIHSNDELGILADTFNRMKSILKSTIDEVSGERAKLETVFSYLRDAVIAFNENGDVLNINSTAKGFFEDKLSPDEPVESQLDLKKLLSLLDVSYNTSLQKTSADFSYSIEDVAFGDKILAVNFGGLKYVENNETRNGTIVVIHDITGRYELERARREFVADVSHELRTPLTSIKGAAETIMSDPQMPGEIRENFLQIAIDECDRMTRIVSDLLTLSKLDSNRNQWQITTFSSYALLQRICEVMNVEAQNHSHTLNFHGDKGIPDIAADKGKIEQVLVNLISNAIKYTPNGGNIDVSLEGARSKVIIKVKDNGIGIPKEHLPKIFDRFYRVQKDRNSDTGGTGLGLAIAKEIIEAHRGSIRIDSEFGKGTEITISLPIRSKLKAEK